MPVPTSNTAPNTCAATCNVHMQSSLSQWGFFLFFFSFLQTWLFPHSSASEPLLALCNLFFLFLGSEEPAAAQFLQTGNWKLPAITSCKCSYSPAPTRQSRWSQLTTICSFLIYLNTLWTPLNFPTALLEDTTHFDKYKPEAIFLCSQSKLKHTALQGSRAKPTLLQWSFAYRFYPSVLLQKHSVLLLFQTQADIWSKFIFIEAPQFW